MSQVHTFAGGPLDRRADRRADEPYLRSRLETGGRVIPVWQQQVLVRHGPDPAPAYVAMTDVPALADGCAAIFLGEQDDTAYFAVAIADEAAARGLSSRTSARFTGLRQVGVLLDPSDAAVLAYARAMVTWHERHGHCGLCGRPTRPRLAGHQRRCTGPACGAVQFPRTDPAIIVLVTAGEDALLVHQPDWPEGTYATIAGFLEPGESLENAVAREVKEEVGVEVRSVDYHSSQPWPFPLSIMIGFTATTTDRLLRPDQDEVEDARWFSRDDVLRELRSRELRISPPLSISFRLIADWFDAGGGDLEALVAAVAAEGG